jgi:hypothetical protein
MAHISTIPAKPVQGLPQETLHLEAARTVALRQTGPKDGGLGCAP